MPIRLAFSSNAYLDVPVEEAIARIASFGYQGIELLADVPHAWPAGLLEVQKDGQISGNTPEYFSVLYLDHTLF